MTSPIQKTRVRAPHRPKRSPIPAQYEDLLKLPKNVRGEILFGEIITSPRPSPAHQRAMLKMVTRLEGKWGDGSGGSGAGLWVFLTEPELHLDKHVVIPDIAAWKASRVDASFYSRSWISLLPDWVCEIQSPSTARVDRVAKRRAYHQLKIPYYWLLDPIALTLETMKYSRLGWTTIGTFGGNDQVQIEPFAELVLPLDLFWAAKVK